MDPDQTSDSRLLSRLNPKLLSELRRIELRSKRRVSADLMGRYRSAFRGSGLSFSDLRSYEPGDDVKHIHWKVTARTGKPFVKTYDEDRQLRIFLLVDCSASTGVGGGRSKHSRAMEFAALISLLVFKSHDQIGLCLFSDEIEEYLSPKSNRHQFTRVLLTLLSHRTLKPATDLKRSLHYVNTHERRPCIVFLISDFVAEDYTDELQQMALRHDLIAVKISDPTEESTSPLGIVQYQDAETGKISLVDLSTMRARSMFQHATLERDEAFRHLVRRFGGDILEISDNPLRALSDLMNRRIARVR